MVPVFNDGVESLVCEFTVSIDQPENLRAVRVVAKGITDPAEVEEVSVYRIDKKGDQLLARSKGVQTTLLPVGPAGTSVELPEGKHRLALKVKTRPGADLTHRIGLRIEGIDFADDRRIEAGPDAGFAASRLAYRIHRKGEHACDTFRIPGLSRANDGSLLAVYDMRYNSRKDLQEDIDIGLSRSLDGGRTWTPSRPIMDMGAFGGKPQKENGCSDPNILVDRNKGTILVSALWTYGKPGTHQWKDDGSGPGLSPDETTQFMIVRSEDHGVTWSSPINMTTRLKRPEWWLFAPAPGNGITLRDGTLVMPTQGRDERGVPFSNLMSSKDGGDSWTVSSFARTDTTECAVAELADGAVLLSMRDNRNREDKGATNGRAVSVTRDLGSAWQVHPADHGALPEPVCMASMISRRLADGRTVLLFSNPRDKQDRRNMTIQASLDGGLTWREEHRVLLDDGKGYGYSSLAMVDDSTVGILFESSVADMVFMKIPLSDILGF